MKKINYINESCKGLGNHTKRIGLVYKDKELLNIPITLPAQSMATKFYRGKIKSGQNLMHTFTRDPK